MQHTREAVRVKVKKCESNVSPEWRKFSVDPQITSLEVLYSLLQKAFDIKSDFSIKYKAFDPAGNEIYLSVLSDWDLDAAFLRIHNLSIQTATEPCLMLQIDIKPFTEVKEWDTSDTSSVNVASRNGSISNAPGMLSPSSLSGGGVVGAAGGGSSGTARELISPLQQSLGVSQKYVQHMQTKLPGLIMNQMEKTFSIVQKAFNLSEETMSSLPPRAPLADNEFRMFLDALGQIQRSDELRKVIFFGGIDPSLRRVVWKHILNVYPGGMNGHQRMDYMRRKSEHYYKLRDTWKTAVKQGCVVGELAYVTSMVKKDVLRTDRLHPFYAGSDDNQNIAALFNILTTYALNHPSVSYCQGMSDLASPLLVTMNDEAQAYICFCAIMARVRGNFMLDGVAMTQKFAHLTEALSYYDPEFWDYLKSQQADDLLFCYRWLLLELKREFPFDDALRMLEVQWSSLKYESSLNRELQLYEKEFVPIMESSAPTTSSSLSSSFGAGPLSPSYLVSKTRENAYTKVCALRRQSSSASLSSLSSSVSSTRLDNMRRLNQSLDDNISQHASRRQRHTSAKAHQSLDETKMLMLIEQAQQADANHKHADVGNDVDVDDDVFASSEAVQHFNFHPTNPFKEDAQLNTNAHPPSKAAISTKNPMTAQITQKTFLNSTSSSIAEDESIGDTEHVPPTAAKTHLPKGIAKLHNKNILSNYTAVSSIIAKQMANTAVNVGDNVRRVADGGGTGNGNSSVGGGGHFKELKEKIAATSRKGLSMSFDEATKSINSEKSQQKLVKNFNEFLNFAAMNKNRIADKFGQPGTISSGGAAQKPTSPDTTLPASLIAGSSTTTTTTTSSVTSMISHPVVQLTKEGYCGTSLDDSDESSSVPDTTWSGSTAATAIQQGNNLSNQSLHLELCSLSSAAHTPERTPTHERATIDADKTNGANNGTAMNDVLGLTPDDSQDQEYYPMSTAISRELRLEAENLDRQVFGEEQQPNSSRAGEIEYEKLGRDPLDLMDLELKENEIVACPDLSELLVRRRNRAKGGATPSATEQESSPWQATSKASDFKSNPFIDETTLLLNDQLPPVGGVVNSNSFPEVLVPISTGMLDTLPVELATNAVDEIAFPKTSNNNSQPAPAAIPPAATQSVNSTTSTLPPILPAPTEFGGGNPFLMFLCLTLLLQHRNTIMKSGMDYNEIAMHFDKMVRKHDVTRVLNQARRMYIDYLKAQNVYKQRLNSLPDTSDVVGVSNSSSSSNLLPRHGCASGAATKTA